MTEPTIPRFGKRRPRSNTENDGGAQRDGEGDQRVFPRRLPPPAAEAPATAAPVDRSTVDPGGAGWTFNCSASRVTTRKAMHISSVVCSPQVIRFGGWFGFRGFCAELS